MAFSNCFLFPPPAGLVRDGGGSLHEDPVNDCRAGSEEGERRALLLHYHVFKNAGSSFEWALNHAFGDSFRPFDTSTPHGFISGHDIRELWKTSPELKAISTHQAAPPPPELPQCDVLTTILIRDPIARIRSIYAFERRQGATTPGAVKARELTFLAYVQWRLEASPAMLCNYQTLFCTRTSERKGGRKAGEEQLQKAISNLDLITVVGTVERYDEWLALTQAIVADYFPGIILPVARENVTAHRPLAKTEVLDQLMSELGAATANHLLEHNKLDMRLHQIADSLLSRKLAERGIGSFLDQTYQNAQRRLGAVRETVE